MRRKSSRALVTISHAWVLHRRLLVRVGAAVIVALAIAGLYQVRDRVEVVAYTVSDLMAGRFATSGFAVSEISITGQLLTSEQDIILALGLGPTISTVNFDAEAARGQIEELPAVTSATIRKIYPGRIIVEIVEREPVARWRVDGVTHLIDARGAPIGSASPAFDELPLVLGEGAADDALVMIRNLERFEMASAGLVAISRIADRRWDLIFKSGLRVRLPELGVAQALTQLSEWQEEHLLLDRDLDIIDMRVRGIVALRPTLRDEAEEA
jgi:cell division protein FtsQ